MTIDIYVQLVNTWSFQVPSQDEIAKQIKSWGWTVSRVRESGSTGNVFIDSRAIRLPSDVDIEVVYIPPKVGQTSAAMEEGLDVFERLNIQAIPVDQSERVAETAKKLLALPA